MTRTGKEGEMLKFVQDESANWGINQGMDMFKKNVLDKDNKKQ